MTGENNFNAEYPQYLLQERGGDHPGGAAGGLRHRAPHRLQEDHQAGAAPLREGDSD